MIVLATHTLAYRTVRFSPPPQTFLQMSLIIGMVVLGQPHSDRFLLTVHVSNDRTSSVMPRIARGVNAPILSDGPPLLEEIGDWRGGYLSLSDEGPMIEDIRRCASTRRSAGDNVFIGRIEELLGRALTPEPIGRPRKSGKYK